LTGPEADCALSSRLRARLSLTKKGTLFLDCPFSVHAFNSLGRRSIVRLIFDLDGGNLEHTPPQAGRRPTRQVEAIFPTGAYRLPGVNVGVDQTVVVGIAVATAIGLVAFFHRTHLGLQTRAVVGDRDLTELVGASSRRVTTFSWMLGCSFAALSGILFSPFIQLDSLRSPSSWSRPSAPPWSGGSDPSPSPTWGPTASGAGQGA
jgi:hypothetical protein